MHKRVAIVFNNDNNSWIDTGPQPSTIIKECLGCKGAWLRSDMIKVEVVPGPDGLRDVFRDVFLPIEIGKYRAASNDDDEEQPV